MFYDCLHIIHPMAGFLIIKSLSSFINEFLLPGSVKAHMLHSGDKEGPSMTASLRTCEKAVGTKLSMDAQTAVC